MHSRNMPDQVYYVHQELTLYLDLFKLVAIALAMLSEKGLSWEKTVI